MSIPIKGWHGRLSPKLAKEMDAIAMPIEKDYIWEFEGSVGDFADKWGKPFLAYPPGKIQKADLVTSWNIFVTDHNSFGAR